MSFSDDILHWSGALGGLTGVAALAKVFWDRRKNNAVAHSVEVRAAEVITKNSLALIEPFEKRVKDLNEEVEQLRAGLRALHDYVDELLSVIHAAGLPVPAPPAAALPPPPRRRRRTSSEG